MAAADCNGVDDPSFCIQRIDRYRRRLRRGHTARTALCLGGPGRFAWCHDRQDSVSKPFGVGHRSILVTARNDRAPESNSSDSLTRYRLQEPFVARMVRRAESARSGAIRSPQAAAAMPAAFVSRQSVPSRDRYLDTA